MFRVDDFLKKKRLSFERAVFDKLFLSFFCKVYPFIKDAKKI